MIEKRDVEVFIDAVSEVINTHIAEVARVLRAEFDETLKRHIAVLPPGLPGKDAAPVDLQAIAERAASLIRAPKDGMDAPPVDIDSLVLRVAELVPHPKDPDPIDYESIVSRVLLKIPIPENGKDAPPVDIDSLVMRVAEIVPRPTNGKDGKDADPVDISSICQRVLQQIPKPRDGRDADPGVIEKLVRDAVDAGLKALPEPKKGDPGEPGKPGADGRSPEPSDLEPIIAACMSRQVDKWSLDFERRAQDLFQRAIEKMPSAKDGRDAFQLEDLTVEHDGDGLVTLSFVRGDLTRSFELRLPRFKDRGVFRDGESYRAGDGVTFAGSFFIAQKDNPQGKPEAANSEWRLAVKRGRDGKDGQMKPPKPEGPVAL